MIYLLICMVIYLMFNDFGAGGCKTEQFKNVNFDCVFSINTNTQSLYCNSSLLSASNTFLILNLTQTDKNKVDSTDFFLTFLNSNLKNDSSLYSCENIPSTRDVPKFAKDFCIRLDGCIRKVESFLKTSFVKQLNITSNNVPLANFEDLTYLTSISILNNNFLNLSKEFLESRKYLETLVLRNNSIKSFQDRTFDVQNNLTTLDLSVNILRNFPKDALGSLVYLKYLNISHNLLEAISNNDFSGFPNLTEVDLSYNKLELIEGDTFNFNSLLKKINLSHNNLSVLPDLLFTKLTNLENISCRKCRLYELNDNLFVNNLKLLRVDFSENNIEILTTDVFRNQFLLEIIHFNKNRISILHPFKNKPRLHGLSMSENNLSSLHEDLFAEAPLTFWIILNKNKLSSITDNHLKHLRNVGFLDLSHNEIKEVELGKTTQIMIRTIHISHNLVQKFDVGWRSFVYLERLRMDNNRIEYLELPPCIPNVKQTITFSFKFNNISRVGLKSLLKDEKQVLTDRNMAGCLFNGMPKNFLDLTYNPLNCDCNLFPLHNYIKQKRRNQLDSIINIGNLTCNSPVALKNELVSQLPGDVFSCKVLDDCPTSCTCGIRGQDGKTFVNCTNAGLSVFPQIIPFETTVVYFNRNHLRDFYSLNYQIYKNLTEIHADNNKISNLEGWKIPQNLKHLSLKENKIQEIPESLSDFINYRNDFELFLGNSEKNCDCKKKALKTFLLRYRASIRDINNITCEIDNNGTKSILPLIEIPDSILCPTAIKQNFNPKLLIWLCVLFVVMITILLVYYKHRQLILSFLYIHCELVYKLLCKENEQMEEKVFDAFIAYSSCNRAIVMDLLDELEEKQPFFKLCIHERDWLPGRYISDNIIHSVQSSKRTIIILSNDFISSPWFRLELRAAVFKVSKDKMNKIIVILADSSTSLDGIDTELRHVITKRTYLVWGERWFWEKLKYAMPHKSCDRTEEGYVTLNDTKRNSERILIENEITDSNSVVL